MPEAEAVCLGDAVNRFLASCPPKDPVGAQQVLQKFLRWYGRDRTMDGLRPWEIEHFGQSSGADSLAKLAPVKAFLIYAHKEGMTKQNLGAHLKVKRTPIRQKQAKRAATPVPAAQLSQQGYDRVQQELENLKTQRVAVAEEIKRAMADKDFRENAPLDAARDQQAHLEARIREMEQTLRFAEIVEGGPRQDGDNRRTRIGSQVVVHDLEMDEDIAYTLVDPNEVDLAEGKISVDSPAGRAILNRAPGELVEVNAPGGVHHLRIRTVEN